MVVDIGSVPKVGDLRGPRGRRAAPNEFSRAGHPPLIVPRADELRVNDDIESPDGRKTFAFDVLNGGVGFLNACQVGVQMIGAGRADHAMVVASEVENNTAEGGHPLYGLHETGSAVILGRTDGAAGFGRFVFHHHPEYSGALETYFQHRDGQSWLQIDRDPNVSAHYLDCIPSAVEELLKLEELQEHGQAVVGVVADAAGWRSPARTWRTRSGSSRR